MRRAHALICPAVAAALVACTDLSGPGDNPPSSFLLISIDGKTLPTVIAQGTDAAGPYTFIMRDARLALPFPGSEEQFQLSATIAEERPRADGSLLITEEVLSDGGTALVSSDSVWLRYADGSTDAGVISQTVVDGITVQKLVFGVGVAGARVYEFRGCTIRSDGTCVSP